MFSCRHVSRLLSDRLERSLSWLERACLHLHLLGCEPCRRFARTLRFLHTMLASSGNGERLSPEAKDRIQHALDAAIQGE